MNFYKYAIIVFLFVFLAAAILVKNFNFLKNITSSFLSTVSSSNIKEAVKINKNLQINLQKAIYSTIWIAKSKRIDDLIRIADNTEINAIVIDVKDGNVYIDDYIKNLVVELHKKNIYAIARIIVFADNSQINIHPDWYFKKLTRQSLTLQASAGGEDDSLWQDRRGWYWLNPSNENTWLYNLEIAKLAIDAGFDEINFDYIRFPAFSKDDDVIFPASVETLAGKPPQKVILKNQVINNFANYLTSELKKYNPEIILSVDLFAYNMLNSGDLGVGQVFLELYDYFDYISPMIYPSHYISGNFGFENPAEYPYEVVFETIKKGKAQLWEKSVAKVGTTTPHIVGQVFEKYLKKLRPWLQDFNIGAVYDNVMIRKEKQAVYDAGLTSGWLLWNPKNVYTEEALDK